MENLQKRYALPNAITLLTAVWEFLFFCVNCSRSEKATYNNENNSRKLPCFQVTPIATGVDFPLNIDFEIRSHKATKLDLDSKCKLNGIMEGNKEGFFKVCAPSEREIVSFCGQMDIVVL